MLCSPVDALTISVQIVGDLRDGDIELVGDAWEIGTRHIAEDAEAGDRDLERA
jgi:hypothetical protein